MYKKQSPLSKFQTLYAIDERQMNYVKIVIHYCSEEFDEIIGVTEGGDKVAAFVIPGYFKNEYPMDHNILYIDTTCVFTIPSINYHIIPYMRYGTIALFLLELFPQKNFILKAQRAVEKLFKNIILYTSPISSQNIVHITNHKLVINDQIYEMEEIPLALMKKKKTVMEAISKTQSTNCIMTDFTKDIGEHSTRSFFFTIYKL